MTTALLFMGDENFEETFRARVYIAEDEQHRRRRAFVEELATNGVIDCPAYDRWVRALQSRGWLDEKPVLEPFGDGTTRCHGRWKLNAKGRTEWAAMKAKEACALKTLTRTDAASLECGRWVLMLGHEVIAHASSLAALREGQAWPDGAVAWRIDAVYRAQTEMP